MALTYKDVEEVITEFKEEGHSDEEIVVILYSMYQDDLFGEEELENILKIIGYELTEEFKKLSEDEKKTKGLESINIADKMDNNFNEEIEILLFATNSSWYRENKKYHTVVLTKEAPEYVFKSYLNFLNQELEEKYITKNAYYTILNKTTAMFMNHK